EASERLIAPYALKEFKGRWYVLGKDEKDSGIKTFGLDRIINIEITKKKFPYPVNFDLADTYKNSFGIISPPQTTPEKIILEFDADQGKYIKSFPLHSSQQTIKDDRDTLLVSIDVHATHDMVMEILSYGNRVRVIEPQHLKATIRNIYSEALMQYQ
ncbi:MAG TPA: WYL domain-containing protein, partial [Sphingobacteriaceae bacterium]